MRNLSILLILALTAGAAFGHATVTWFMPTVPDPLSMTMDGNDDDWGWFDQNEFALVDWNAIQGQGRLVDPDGDFSMAIFPAWSPPPDNALYMFTRITDDTLRIQQGAAHAGWWDDDTIVVGLDMDHSGGFGVADEESGLTLEDAVRNGYRLIANPAFSLDPDIGLHEPTSNHDDPALADWAVKEPRAFYGGTLLPASAENFATNIEATFEWKVRTYDELDMTDYPSSIPHTFEADQISHIHIDYADGDWGAHGQSQFWGLEPAGDCCSWTHDHDQQNDVIPLLTTDGIVGDSFADGGTAVEHTTWARIKSTLSK